MGNLFTKSNYDIQSELCDLDPTSEKYFDGLENILKRLDLQPNQMENFKTLTDQINQAEPELRTALCFSLEDYLADFTASYFFSENRFDELMDLVNSKYMPEKQ